VADHTETREEPVTERDAVNDAVRDAITSLKGEAPEVLAPETPEVAPVEAAAPAAPELAKEDHPTDPRRFKDGTFKTASEATAKAAPQKQAAAPQPKLPTAENPAEASPAPSKAPTPPVSWSADAKQVWASLPPAVQTAALKREEEVSRGFRQYSEQTKAYERVLAPVEQEAQRAGLNVEQGIQRLLDGHRFLETQPVQAVLWLAQKHGLNLAEIAANPPAPQTPVRSEPSIPPQFVQQVSSLEERLNRMDMDQNMAGLEQFAADPKNAHYSDVEDQLPGIMRELAAVNPALKGVPLLSAAYDRAIWLNQDVRSKLIAEQTQQTQQVATQKIAEKSAKAQRAAVSIRGSSADTRPPPKAQQNGAGHVTDDVRAAIDQLRAQ
jgi:hypothetical protein